MKTILQAVILVLSGHLFVLAPFAHAEPNDRFARVVLFIPDDVKAPENFESRLASLAERAERFLAKWTKHWKYPVERSKIFARDAKGAIEVTLVKGKLTSANGRAALPEIRRKAIEGATRKLSLKPDEEVVWWVLYDYPGVKGFQGGARKFGGVAINAYPPGTDPIDEKVELASPALAKMAIKGTIHELGHALGLPHIGPRPEVKLGNSLMGPVNRSYWRKTGSDDARVYLSEAAAAALWKHPIFRKEATASPAMPKEVRVTALKTTAGPEGKKITVSGTLKASVPAHTALALDSARSRYGDYWTRSYAGRVDRKTGKFEVVISEPFERGTIYLVFCLSDGINTSDGKLPLLRGSSLEISYETKDGKRQFDETP